MVIPPEIKDIGRHLKGAEIDVCWVWSEWIHFLDSHGSVGNPRTVKDLNEVLQLLRGLINQHMVFMQENET